MLIPLRSSRTAKFDKCSIYSINKLMNSSSRTTAYMIPGHFIPVWIGVSAKNRVYTAPLFAADAPDTAGITMLQTLMQGVVRT